MENPKQYIALGIVVIMLIILSILGRRKRIQSSWKGTLEKKIKTYDEGGRSYRLVVRLDSGKKKRVFIKKDLFKSLSEGDKLVKKPGEYDPQKA